ncbi:MAG: SURF1 family protein [Burkholderiaceae bacterium]|nr:SURF1 family protein [Burkholderiaceae bacterium]MCD8515832.1 SURF1 family protein [Burkholderiaceae bacterium]MCD8536168.1 SURF1 family protein [Burkholderiaceae bacterium]MCD8565032.1 SURF1 family protein [Burkholderiaceae bacterium]
MADTPVNHQSHPTRMRTKRRSILAAILLAILGTLFVSLGNWQLNRATERTEIAAMIEAGRRSAPVQISATVNTDTLKPWQSAQASGRWLPELSVLLDNRNLDGKPGFWLATPLSLNTQTAVLVLRGWVARPIGNYNPFPEITQGKGEVTVAGEIALRVPQLYEIANEPVVALGGAKAVTENDQSTTLDLAQLQQRQNISVQELSEVSGIQFLPVVLMQTNAADGEALARQWPTPSVDSDTNKGYAMQWFSFAAIAFGAMGILLWKTLRRATIRR